MSIISIKTVTPYSGSKTPLPLPVIAQTFAESSLVFQLVKIKNNISVNDTVEISKKVIHIQGLVQNTMLSRYKHAIKI